MTKPRSQKEIKFPFKFEKNGRQGKIYKTGSEKFQTVFMYAGKRKQNMFNTFDTAYTFLDSEFSKLDTDSANCVSLYPLDANVKQYSELEKLVKDETGETLRDAVNFFLAHRKTKKFEPKTVLQCANAFVDYQEKNGVTPIQIKTLKKHFKRFERDFGKRNIHEIETLEIFNWLGNQVDEKRNSQWSAKTKKSVRGSLVSLSLFARDKFKAIPDTLGKTEFQKVSAPKQDEKAAVEIYTPVQIQRLLETAMREDIDLIPALVVGNFLGLRPYEFHAEGLKRNPLEWESFNWNDGLLHVKGQKIRSKATRDVPFNGVVKAWLEPFKGCTGAIWKHKKAYEDKMNNLRKKAGIEGIHDGYRHSYASYRNRILKGNLSQLSDEMGNSPKELVDSYKKNVTDKEAKKFFAIKTPKDYATNIKAFLKDHQS